ncbi:response regulator transcription factor [Paractinoplanes lichenicola]|uniref:Response regulator transcription factor n=1 Tax=Paractinoplanes lichenicola TaxID=2802976 RepID=A0ABS1VL19_9ACTN|nr:response regulator transcription factor [Actinoplanes lichenicola]MBL7255412.1 response regulator transcription factor [Actinoplanes lichenicola]
MRVVVAEDLTLLRDGIVRMLEAYGFEVVAAVGTGPDLLKALLTDNPDVAVVDVRLPPGFSDEGLRAALTARAEKPGLPILVLSQYVERLYARELLADGTGGIGYLLKDRVSDIGEFVDAVQRVAAGGTVLDPTVVAKLMGSKPKLPLTPREHEVLSHMAQGRSNAAIGAALFITEKAVANHTNNIFAKLGLQASEDDNRRVLAVLKFLEGY